ncbi:MAG: tetratricopeptide repeat protein, partial [Opitutaceae bacterium]|nr:tetratricopeptide repeat protein [Opitutaceae bacterium]
IQAEEVETTTKTTPQPSPSIKTEDSSKPPPAEQTAKEPPALIDSTPVLKAPETPIEITVPVATANSQENFVSSIALINELLSQQRDRELEMLQKSNQFTLIMVGIIAATALISILGVVYLQTRATNQALIKSYLPSTGHGDPSSLLALHSETSAPLSPPIITESNQSFMNAVEGLEKRIHDIEHISSGSDTPSLSNTESTALAEAEEIEILERKAEARLTEQVTLLLNKGQTLLQLDRLNESLVCFDEAVSLDSNRAEAFVKRGTALEKLQRVDEAISAYDQAIALDENLATAYLNKAGILNRLERYNEALECYEQALEHNKTKSLEVV